ncbi:replication initiator protein A [Helcococcus kunzii]|uniref:replication initiator protein A n=1 Tax=Helcococcus kunzii TaxID=40091 RepID=UPI0024AD5192|nr:replication initiator protein A [Helcococcus kunzii]
MLYGVLLDRSSLSYKNGWIDEDERVYIIFTIEEIQETLNCGKNKAINLLKELDTNKGIGLVEKKQIGLNKPNRMYIRNFMKYTL